LFAVIAVVAALAPLVVAEGPAEAQFSLASSPVSTSRGQRVSDVVAEARADGRADSIDQQILDLADDPTAFVDSLGRPFFVDEEFPVEGDLQPNDAPISKTGVPLPTGSPFALNSRPGSTKTIYLDFDGETVAGTAWNNSTYPSVTMPPFSRDADPAFSTAELTDIGYVWQAVAEDFAPFDVNVTTQRPGPDAFVRNYAGDPTYGVMAVVTTGDKSWLCSTCGGIAYIDVFERSPYYGPAWVLPRPTSSTRQIANIASHEVGHNLSLDHDGTQAVTYYGGHGTWGPIMGSGSRQYTQWSRGEYSGANQLENDTFEIGLRTGFVPDESTSFADAVRLPTLPKYVTGEHIIGVSPDVDYFAVDIIDSSLNVVLTRSATDPNLSPSLSFYGASGQLIGSTQLVNGAEITLQASALPPGRYYIGVSGAGYLTPFDGFSSYGSNGYYRLTVTQYGPVTAPTGLTLRSNGNRSLISSWVSTAGPGIVYSYVARLCSISTGNCAEPIQTTGTSAIFEGLPAPDTFELRVETKHLGGTTTLTAVGPAAAVLVRPIAPTITRLRFNDSASEVAVEWYRGESYAPVLVSGTDIYVRNRAIGTWTVAATITSNEGRVVLPIPPTWTNVDVDVKMISRTNYAAPFDISDDSATASFRIGRVAAPQVPNITPAPREPAAQVPGISPSPRTTAPQS
jgi:hypothetical protein